MLIESALLAALLSQPAIKPEELDMHYKECRDRYAIYLVVKQLNYLEGILYGENLRILCTPIRNPHVGEM